MVAYHDERMISANGIEICSDAFGDPSDPAVLLVMGAGSSMLLWEGELCEPLAEAGRFVIRYDNRDTGRTTSVPIGECNYTIDDMAADGIAVLDAWGVDKAHIVGASMGGMITQVIGLNHPDRVLTLTPIMSTPDPGAVLDAIAGRETRYQLSPPTMDVIQAAGEAMTLDFGDRDAVLDNRVKMFEILNGSAYPYDVESRRELFGAELDRALNFASTQNHAAAIEGSDRWHERLDQISVPTLVIHGTEDPILPLDHGEALAASIPGATMLALEGVGHEIPEGSLGQVIPALIAHTQ